MNPLMKLYALNSCEHLDLHTPVSHTCHLSVTN